MSRPPAPFLTALVMGASLYHLPEKVENGTHYPPVERLHLHVMWFDDKGGMHTGTAPAGHLWAAGGQEETILVEALRQWPVGSELSAEDLNAAVAEKAPEKIVGPGGMIRKGYICGWYCHYESGAEGEAPFLRRFLVVRRQNADKQWRTDHVKLEFEAEVWPLEPGELIPQIIAAFEDMRRANDIYGEVFYAKSKGNYWRASAAQPAEAPRHEPAPAKDGLDAALASPAPQAQETVEATDA